jgi:hypothetical protein
MVLELSGKMAQFVREHPRLLGALFTAAMLLAQVQPVLADCNAESCTGP